MWGISLVFRPLVRQNKSFEDTALRIFHKLLLLFLKTEKRPWYFIAQCRFYACTHWLSLSHTFKPSFHRAKCRSGREMLPPPRWCIHGRKTSQKRTVFWWLYQAAPGTLWWIVGTDEIECLFCECGKNLLPWSLRIIHSECADAGTVSCCLV